MTTRNIATCSTKLKTLSGAATYGDMSANYPLSLTAGPLETHLPDLRVWSKSKLMSSSVAGLRRQQLLGVKSLRAIR
ncbi:hypothetical protein BHE74_00058111, partial [Ensete ventricosum]